MASTAQQASVDDLSRLSTLTTEGRNEAAHGLDTISALEIARVINGEDAKIAAAVRKALPQIAQVIDAAANALREDGRLIYVGAGSSGRLGALDSAECPPTYGTRREQVQYVIAGGPKALGMAVEADEDSRETGERDIARKRPTRKDLIIGLAASGRTPYTVAALEYARTRGAVTAAVVCNRESPLAAAVELPVEIEVGPEVVSGSTRMKAGTAQKMVCNMITTGAMTRLGYVYDNLMVNVNMRNEKLVERGIRVLMQLTGIDRPAAVQTIRAAGKSLPVAVVMLKAGVDKPEAVRRLTDARGNVRQAIGEE